MIGPEDAARLLARDERGEQLTAAEWRALSVWHANRAVRSSRIWLVLMCIAACCAAVSFAFAVLA